MGFGFELGLLDLLLLQRQRVLHGIGFGLSLKHSHLGLAFRLFYLLGFCGFGLKLRDPHLLLLNVGLHSHLIVLLFFEEQVFKTFGVFRR